MCAYAFAASVCQTESDFGALSIDFIIDATFQLTDFVSGSILRVEYVVDEYVGGTLVSTSSGVVAGGTSSVINYGMTDSTFIYTMTIFTTDGAVLIQTNIIECRPSIPAITDSGWKSVDLLSLTCEPSTMIVDTSAGAFAVRTTDFTYRNNAGATIANGQTYIGDVPADGVLKFDFGLNAAQWLDLPANYQPAGVAGWTLNGVMCLQE